jgi:hypothetical protein
VKRKRKRPSGEAPPNTLDEALEIARSQLGKMPGLNEAMPSDLSARIGDQNRYGARLKALVESMGFELRGAERPFTPEEAAADRRAEANELCWLRSARR